MDATTTTFTAEQWARHEKFVEMFRAAKRRKQEWQARRIKELEAEEEYARLERARIDAIFKDLDDEAIVPREQAVTAHHLSFPKDFGEICKISRRQATDCRENVVSLQRDCVKRYNYGRKEIQKQERAGRLGSQAKRLGSADRRGQDCPRRCCKNDYEP